MKRQWRIRRDRLAVPDGQQRWDRAYQHLLHWTAASPPPLVPSVSHQPRAEVEHEGSDLRAGVDAAAGAGADD
jgi:uncharacterized protein (UPF0548 family)